MKVTLSILLLFCCLFLEGKAVSPLNPDTLKPVSRNETSSLFYDSLAVKASRSKFTRWLHNSLIQNVADTAMEQMRSYGYYDRFRGKIIGSIGVRPMKAFGPTFDDTTKTTQVWIEKVANAIHSQSDISVIRKNLWFEEGQAVDVDLMMDNERLLRTLPFLKDVRILLTPRALNPDVVDVLVLAQDIFSVGITVRNLSGLNSGQFGLYDKNVLGMGHEIGATMVGHTGKEPHLGFETYYAINNIHGNFIDFIAGYSNTYKNNGILVSLKRDFLRPQTIHAGGLSVIRNFRSDRLYFVDPVVSETVLNYVFLDGWYGRGLNLGIKRGDNRFQLTLSGRIRYSHFYERPMLEMGNKHYYSNSVFFLGGLSFSQRSYVRDYLVYSYGITEDIPKGYLCELVFGLDRNEFGNRAYSHLFLSTGNLFKNKPFYFYASLGGGTFFNKSSTEQGMIAMKTDFISRLHQMFGLQTRYFVKLNYTIGINRFECENLYLRNDKGIRGFGSREEKGQQRLSFVAENVLFMKRKVLNFRSALFTFVDLGLIGSSQRSVLKENYYLGLGVGLRIRNEALVFKTLQLRLAYYPNHPRDVHPVGFIIDGVSKTRFYDFQPRGPEPMRFE